MLEEFSFCCLCSSSLPYDGEKSEWALLTSGPWSSCTFQTSAISARFSFLQTNFNVAVPLLLVAILILIQIRNCLILLLFKVNCRHQITSYCTLKKPKHLTQPQRSTNQIEFIKD